MKKEDLLSSACYLLAYKDQVNSTGGWCYTLIRDHYSVLQSYGNKQLVCRTTFRIGSSYFCSLAAARLYRYFSPSQFFLRLGKGWKQEVSPSKIAEEYILQYYGFKTEADFVVTVVHEGSEGEMFWKWFKLQVINLEGVIDAVIASRGGRWESDRFVFDSLFNVPPLCCGH